MNPRRRRPVAFVLVAACLAVAGGCGAAGAWYVGVFTPDGRFGELDACTLLPPPGALAPLVPDGAREPGDSRPRSLFGWGGGDTSSQCKWSSRPPGRDRPFRTVRVHVETKVHVDHTSGETRAARQLSTGLRNTTGRGQPVEQVKVGADGYATTDRMQVQIVFSRTVIYDLHVRFRISNALVDVSARTHTSPGAPERALVRNLAAMVAGRLDG